MYGFIIPENGLSLLAKLQSGSTLEITRVMIGNGKVQDKTNPNTLNDLISPLAQATSTKATTDGTTTSFIIEYRNDLNGGQRNDIVINEFGVFANDPDVGEILLYYANLGDYPEPVKAYIAGQPIITRRYPVSITVSGDVNISMNYAAEAFMTAEDVADYYENNVFPHLNNHVNSTNNPHKVTKDQVGLGKVPNVGTDEQTPTFEEAEKRENITSGEKLSTLFGKIKKWFSDLKNVAFTGKYSDLTGTPESLKNPQPLNFTGGATGSYDGSEAKTVKIPSTAADVGAVAKTGDTMIGNLNIQKTDPYLRLQNQGGGGDIFGIHLYGTASGANTFGIFDTKNNVNVLIIPQSDKKVHAAYGFVGDLTGNAATASKLQCEYISDEEAETTPGTFAFIGKMGPVSKFRQNRPILQVDGGSILPGKFQIAASDSGDLYFRSSYYGGEEPFASDWKQLAAMDDLPTIPNALKNPQPLNFTGGASGSYDGSNAKTVNIPNALSSLSDGVWKAGDNLYISSMMPLSGIISSSTKSIHVLLPLGKPVASGVTASLTTLYGTLRGAQGYIDGSNGIDFKDGSPYTVSTVLERAVGLLRISIEKSSAFTNVANNTPVNLLTTAIAVSFAASGDEPMPGPEIFGDAAGGAGMEGPSMEDGVEPAEKEAEKA